MNKMTIIGICILALLSGGCNKDLVEYHSNNIRISIEKGDEWLHNFPLFLGINKKNPPQIAIWTEDTEGHYLCNIQNSYANLAGGRRKPKERSTSALVLFQRYKV